MRRSLDNYDICIRPYVSTLLCVYALCVWPVCMLRVYFP